MRLLLFLRTVLEQRRPRGLMLFWSHASNSLVPTGFSSDETKTPHLYELALAAVAALVAVTPEARRALGDRHEARINSFPFKVGRETRSPRRVSFSPRLFERRLGEAPQVNDIYLLEPPSSDPFHVCPEHFSIDRHGHQFFIVDRRSVSGTNVAGKQLGGDRAGGRTELHHGDLIVVGGSSSRYIFRFDLLAFGRRRDAAPMENPAQSVIQR